MSTPTPPPERRRAPRQPCAPGATCRLPAIPGHDSPWPGLHDLCPNGAGLVLSAHLAPGTALDVELRGAGMAMPLALRAQVAHATARPDGTWAVGCAFLRPLPFSLLRLLL